MLRHALEAAVHAEGETEAGAADGLQHLRQLAAAVARHVQDRPELLALQLIEAPQLKQPRREEVAVLQPLGQLAGVQQPAPRGRMRARVPLQPPRARRRRSPDRRRSRACAGSPITRQRIAPISISITRSAISSCRYSTRSAEQRWPALVNAEVIDIIDHLLGQRGGIDHHRVHAAGLGDQRHDRARRGAASVRLMVGRGGGGAGEGDAGERRVA